MAAKENGAGYAIFLGLVILGFLFLGDEEQTGEIQKGDLSPTGGSPTVRIPFAPQNDDPETSNDETNDQPLGHFGTLTLFVTSVESGNSYPLDGEMEGTELRRLYFPRGGWIDFYSCELDKDFSGFCSDEQGRSWSIAGTSALAPSLHADLDETDNEDLTYDSLADDDEEDDEEYEDDVDSDEP